MKFETVIASFGVVFLLSPYAAAQSAPAEPAPAAQPATTATATEPPAAAPPADGGRFRFGINGTAGLESVSGDGGGSASGAMFGADVRLGYQINNLVAVYAQPHLSFGSLSASGANATVTGSTGTIVGTVMGEVTLVDRLFVGAGVGYGILNNPSGFAIEARAGGYPLMSKSENGPRRKGLMIGGDFRSIFVDGATGIMVMGCIGYEAF